MIYTIEQDTPSPGLKKISPEKFEKVQNRLMGMNTLRIGRIIGRIVKPLTGDDTQHQTYKNQIRQ